ncbi:hypothetical protein FUAX_25680 [Fulvitalea axinellae]|uniref:Outer membrane protein assembly factor BamE n=1 Tax=Fulvitalea axinellae TaxID=1182444 RepID=A0AAU9DAX1_9BACT|nr:hypothetical protein FUAX_25680 [Fulvitalea axinellae]
MRKLFSAIFIFFLWLPLVLLLFFVYHQEESSAEEHQENASRVAVGMTTEQVLEIMGPPQEKYKSEKSGDSVYVYETPILGYDNVEVYLSPMRVVVKVKEVGKP